MITLIVFAGGEISCDGLVDRQFVAVTVLTV